jgi:hypothetical protein
VLESVDIALTRGRINYHHSFSEFAHFRTNQASSTSS